jgi:ATP-dependent DNA helicase RecG
VHRSYTDPSDIQIKIFDDKISIFSPGTFYGGLSVADIQADNYRSSLRNKLKAEGFYLINAIEKYGSGFIRIRKALQEYPEINFEFKEFAGGVMVTFTQHSRQREAQAPQVTPQVTPQVNQLLTVLTGEMTRQELMTALGLKDRKHFADTYLQPALKQGLIEMTRPDKPNSRLQKYRLNLQKEQQP